MYQTRACCAVMTGIGRKGLLVTTIELHSKLCIQCLGSTEPIVVSCSARANATGLFGIGGK